MTLDEPLHETSRRATVYVAEDHPVFRQGLADAVALRSDLELVGEGTDGRIALEEILVLKPDVALLDVRMPELTGLQVLNAVVRNGLQTAVVMLSAHGSPDEIYAAIASGAVAFVTKDAEREVICDAVAAAARGETQLSSAIQGQLVRGAQRHATPLGPRLTPREQQVLEFIAEGLSAPDIAGRLMLSVATIKKHLQSLYEKLGVSDRAAAVARAMRTGLLE
jgi:two-component system, NarL family, nitrate/nitrite response regulator NarL